MWLQERLADLTTPKGVKNLATPVSEQVVKETLAQREKHVRRLNPTLRAGAWVSLGSVDFAASYLRRSLMRPSRKKELAYQALLNNLTFSVSQKDFRRVTAVVDQMGNLRGRNASLSHIF